MHFIDPHIHMVSRTIDDYEMMSKAGIVAITEPAFWAGFDRSSAKGFYDYFRQLTHTEPARAAQFGIDHYTWMCINPKEAEDLQLADEVLAIIPEFMKKDNVLGIGEIGLNKNSRNELTILDKHLALAEKGNELVLVHTPHLEDKRKGTLLIIDAIKNFSGIAPGRVLIDHVEEHTVKDVLDAGHWGGMTLYPDTKCTPQRAVDILEVFGTERLWMNSAADWGKSDPLSVPKAYQEMRRRGHAPEDMKTIFWDNPLEFLGQSEKFKIPVV